MSYYETTMVMLTILKISGFSTSSLNFNAFIRRNSVERADHFEAHIDDIDAFTVGFEATVRNIADGQLASFVKERYSSFDKGKGAFFAKGKMNFTDLAFLAKHYGTMGIQSGKQKRLKNLVNQYLVEFQEVNKKLNQTLATSRTNQSTENLSSSPLQRPSMCAWNRAPRPSPPRRALCQKLPAPATSSL